MVVVPEKCWWSKMIFFWNSIPTCAIYNRHGNILCKQTTQTPKFLAHVMDFHTNYCIHPVLCRAWWHNKCTHFQPTQNNFDDYFGEMWMFS